MPNHLAASHDTLLAMVLLDSVAFPDPERVTTWLRQRWGNRHRLRWEAPEGDGTVRFLYIDDDRATVALMPAPIPAQELAGPVATSRWEGAAVAVATQKAHLVVALQAPSRGRIYQHLMLTQLVAGLVEAAGAPAVYWGAGSVLQPGGAFMEFAKIATEDDLPLYLWVDFRVHKAAEGGHVIFTTGLHAFGLMEIEGRSTRLAPRELVETVYNTAHYLCQQGPVLEDGHTIGHEAAQRILIRHQPSLVDPARTVIHLHFDGARQTPERQSLWSQVRGMFGKR